MPGDSDKYTFKIDIDANELTRKLEKAFERALKTMKIPSGGSSGGRYLGISEKNLERMQKLLEMRTAEKIKILTAENNMARGMAALEAQYYVQKRKQIEDLKLKNRIAFRAELEQERMTNALKRASVTKYNWREQLAKDPTNRYAAAMGRREQMYYQRPGMLSALGLHNLQERFNKTGIFSPKFTEDQRRGGSLKRGLGMLGIGLGGAAISKMIIDSSPLLQGMMKLMQTTFMLVLRPIGDFFAGILLPIATTLLPAAATFYAKTAPTLFKIGLAIGKALTGNVPGAIEDFRTISETGFNTQAIENISKTIEGISEGTVKTMEDPDHPGQRVIDNIQNRARKSQLDALAGWQAIGDFFTKTIPQSIQKLWDGIFAHAEEYMPTVTNPNAGPGSKKYYGPGTFNENPPNTPINDPRLGGGKIIDLVENMGMGSSLKEVKKKGQMTEEDAKRIQEIWDNIENIAKSIQDGNMKGLDTTTYQWLQHIKTAKQSGKDISETFVYLGNLFGGVYDRLKAAFASLYANSPNRSAAERLGQEGMAAFGTPSPTQVTSPIITQPIPTRGTDLSKKISTLKGVMAFNLVNPTKTYGSIYGGVPGFPEIHSVADIKSFLTGQGQWDSRWNSVTKLASGGILNEPVMGIGKSGKKYLMGEAGPEAVVPMNKMNGGGDSNISLTFHVHGSNSEEIARQLKPTILRIMKEESDRRGRL